MTEFSFRQFLAEICSYFEKKPPSQETGNLWFTEVQDIPDESIKYILSKLKKKESFPRNLPANMWAMFHLWREETPNKKASNNCPDCEGTGWISENRQAYRCGRCDVAPREAYFYLPDFKGMAKLATMVKPDEDDWRNQF